MKIQIIGSGSMWTKYNSASYVIDDEILIDIPNGMCKYLYRNSIEPAKINHVLITHFHGDHYFDTPFYLLNKAKYNSTNTNIYCSKEGQKKIKKLFKLAFPNSVKDTIRECNLQYNFKNEFTINNYRIKKILMDHGRMKPAYGYLFKIKNKYVGFTDDTAINPNIAKMASKCTYLICDCMFIEGTNKHMGIDNLEVLAKKYQDCKFVVSHLRDDTREKLKEMNINNIIVPEDNDIIEI